MDPRLSDAQRAWQRGDVAGALGKVRTLARESDATSDVFEVLAQLCLDQGLLDEARAASESALEREPGRSDLWQRLGVIELQRQDFPAAQHALEKAIALGAVSPSVLTNLGLALQHTGSLDRAAECHRRALALEPNNVSALCNLAAALGLTGEYDEAIRHARRAIALRPDYVNPYMQIALLEADRERFEEAVAWVAKVPRPMMQSPEALTSHAEILNKASLNRAALQVADMAIALRTDFGDAHLARATALSALGNLGDALEAFDKAAALAPQSAAPLTGKAATLLELARPDEAMELFKQARTFEPRSPKVLYMKAAAAEFRLTSDEVSEIESLLAGSESLSVTDRINLHFTLAGAYLSSNAREKVFPHLNEGSRLKRRMAPYNAEDTEHFLQAIQRAFPQELFARAKGEPADAPIFVVGVPRSGTTLVEQILASHPAVLGRGELRDLSDAVRAETGRHQKPFPDWIVDPGVDDFRPIGLDYLRRVGPLPDGKLHFVDKMPGNAVMAGLIHCALPNARIILCRRDPFDTCFSCYSRLFTARQGFTYDLSDLGRYFRAHEALMAHWRRVLPADRFLEVVYEDVVADLEGSARNIVAFCGLDWSEDCLNFHELKRPVRTASMFQVRKPLYSSSIGRWRQFRTELAPLFAALDLPVPD